MPHAETSFVDEGKEAENENINLLGKGQRDEMENTGIDQTVDYDSEIDDESESDSEDSDDGDDMRVIG